MSLAQASLSNTGSYGLSILLVNKGSDKSTNI